MADIEFQGTGGIIEGDLEDANVIVNLDAALDFDGVDDYVEGDDAGLPSGSAARSISMWIKPDAITQAYGSPFTYGTRSSNNGFAITWNNTTATLLVGKYGANSGANSSTIPMNAWSHFVVTMDGSGNIAYYLNGVADGTTTLAGVNTTLDVYRVGDVLADWGTQNFDGTIADVKVFSDVLTAAEAQELSQKINYDISIGSIDNMVLWLKLNEGTGNPADHENNGTDYDGTNNGATWTFDEYSVNVQDNSTTTDGTLTVKQGKLEGKALTSLHFHDDNDYVDIGELGDYTAISMTAWVNPDDATPTSQGIVGFEGNQNGIATGSGSNVLRIKHESVNSSYTDTTYTWAQNKWQQVGFSWDGSTLNVFADGVKINSVSLSGSAWGTSNADIGALTNTTWNFDGQIRDVKLYDYGLSDDQMASLYSGSYNVTPKYWYKLDDCVVGTSITTAVSSGTATSVDGTLTNFENTDGDPLDGAGTGWSNGTLNLDGSGYALIVEDTGTLSAPRGSLLIAGDFRFEDGANFSHNNGEVEFNGEDPYIKMIHSPSGRATPTNPLKFYKLKASTTTNYFNVAMDFTVENTWTITNDGTYGVAVRQPAYITMGTSTAAGTITGPTSGQGNIYFASAATNSKVLAADTSGINPWVYTGNDWGWSAAAVTILLENGDYRTAINTDEGYYNQTTSSSMTIQLTGNMEFDAVTVSSGDTLDVDGQRVYSSGTVDINGNLKMGAGMWHAGGDFDTSNAAVTEEEGATFLLEGDNYIHNNDGSFAGDANTNILLQGTKSTYLNSFESGGYAHYVGNLIVGSGTATLPGPDRSGVLRGKANNITVASGATLTPSGAQEVICLGDFTTSGGIIGTNCIVFDGTDDYVASAVFNDDRSVNNSADYTIELWFRRTETSGTETLFDFAHWDSSGSVYTGQSRSSAYMDANGVIYWDTRTGGGTLNARPQSSAGFDDSKWHHAAFVFKGVSGAHAGTYSAGAKEIWIDGKLEARVLGGDTTTDAGSSVAGNMGYDQNKTMAFQVGRQVVSSIGNFFTGQMDEIRMWSDARTQAEIRDNMFSAVAIDSANLRHYYDCNLFHSSKLEDMADSNTGEDHVEVDITFYGGATYAGTGIFDDGSSTLVMAGTTQTISMKNGNDVNNLTINDGSTTSLLTTDNSAGSIDVVGDLTVHGQLKPLTGKDTCLTMKTNGAKFMIPQALEFDGSNDYITVPDNSSLKFGDDSFSVAFWIKTSQTTSANAYIIHKAEDSAGAGDAWWGVSLDSAEKVHFQVDDGSAARDVLSSTVVNDNKWHHICAVYTKEASLKMYIDGTLETTTSHSLAIDSDSTSVLEIGRPTGVGTGSEYGDYYAGSLVDVKIYNAALSATEVATLASQIIPNDATTENLVAHWKLNEVGTSTTTTATDSAGSNNGTLTNFPSSPWFGNNQTAVNQIYTIFMDVGGTHTNGINLPEFKAKILKCNDSTTTAKGDITCSTELEIASGAEFNANGNTIAAKNVDVNGGTLNLSNSALNFSVTSSSDIFTMSASSTLLSGNTAITGYSSGAKTLAAFAPSGGFEVVGDVKWLLSDADSDLTVIGSVIDCDISASGANIRQWHHTLDTQQLLDADEAGDDDLRLTKPALDNAHELMTG